MSKELFSLKAAAAIAVFLTFMVGSATADEPYPWCAVYGAYAGSNCGFVTLEQCMATVSGIGGSCEPNQFYTGRPAPVGHRQPRAKDLPADVLQRQQTLTPSKKEFDKSLTICKGC
jgi:hypothetical protein